MKIKNKINIAIMIVAISLIAMFFISNNIVEAHIEASGNYFKTSLYRDTSKTGFAIQENTGNSIQRILKINKEEDKNSLFYYTGDVEILNQNKNYSIHYNLKTNLDEAWGDYQKYYQLNRNNSFLNTNKYNQLMWIVDNCYTNIGNNNDENQELIGQYINEINEVYNANINNYNSLTGKYDLLTKDDIDVVQQLAIWHFTSTGTSNDIGDLRQSNYRMDKILITNARLSGKYQNMYQTEAYREKIVAMSRLYNCLIANADANYSSMNLSQLKNSENQLADFNSYDNTTIGTVRSNESYSYVSGPYKLTDNGLGVKYQISSFTCNAEFVEGENADITNEIKIVTRNENGRYDLIIDSEGNEVLDKLQILEKLKSENKDFYLAISSSIQQLKKINLITDVQYTAREVEYYSINNPGENDAPILKIEDVQEIQEYTASAILELTTEMDFSLRQFITAINGQEIKDSEGRFIREPKVNLSYINKRIDGNRITSANYEQTKDIIKVNLGDEITYTIRVYNEGGVNGYVSEITDYLPPYLEYINDEENSSNGWTLQDASNLRVVKTKKLAMIADDDSGNKNQRLIKAFDGETIYYRDVKLKCKVVNPNATDNLAEALSEIENAAQTNEEQEEVESVDEGRIQENPYGTDDMESDRIGLDSIIQYARDIIGGNRGEKQGNTVEHENSATVEEQTERNENRNTQNNQTVTNNNTNVNSTSENDDPKAEIITITNLAEITDFQDEFGNNQNLVDRDSRKSRFGFTSR